VVVLLRRWVPESDLGAQGLGEMTRSETPIRIKFSGGWCKCDAEEFPGAGATSFCSHGVFPHVGDLISRLPNALSLPSRGRPVRWRYIPLEFRRDFWRPLSVSSQTPWLTRTILRRL